MTKKEKDLVGLVKDRKSVSEDFCKPYWELFNEFEDAYLSYIDSSDWEWRSKVFHPEVFSLIETLLPRMMSNNPRVDAVPRGPEDKDQSEIIQDLITYQWERADMFEKLTDLVKSGLIYGTSYGKVFWRQTITTKKYRVPIEMNGQYMGSEIQEKEVVEYDDPDFEVVSPYHLLFAPGATDIQDSKWIIQKSWVTYDELEKDNEQAKSLGFELYKNLKELKDAHTNSVKDDYETNKKRARGASDYELEDDTINKIELWEMWEDDRVVTIANGSIVIRDTDNPFWHKKKPFVRFVDVPVPGEWFGLGEVEPVLGIQDSINSLSNQRQDNVNLILNRMWKVREGAMLDEDELASFPGGIIHLTSLQDAEPVVTQDVTASAYNEVATLKQSFQSASGVSDYYNKGTGVKPSDTATEAMIIQENQSARLRLKIQLFEEMVIKEVGAQWLQLNEQFIDQEKIIRVLGDRGYEFVRIMPGEIHSDYDIIPQAGSTEPQNKQIERQNFLAFGNWITQNGLNGMVDPMEWLRIGADKFSIKNIDSLIVEPQQQGEGLPLATDSDLGMMLGGEQTGGMNEAAVA